jgi:hypothetical protein
MKKSLITSIALAAGLSTAVVEADEFDSSSSVKIENAACTVYTPSMPIRREGFYVGSDG